MRLADIQSNPESSSIYLDRYVNDGSPSGFSEKNKTSPETDTFSLVKGFNLLAIIDDEEQFDIYGRITPNISMHPNEFYIHPDMKNHEHLKYCKIQRAKAITVVPTSSFRTVRITNALKTDFIKLHYDGVIGRINRRLNRPKAIAGVEVSNIITQSIQSGELSGFISLYQEPFAKIHRNPKLSNETDHWGMVWRTSKPIGQRSDLIEYVIPLFSFWSVDRLEPGEMFFFDQLCVFWGTKAKEKLISELLLPLLDTYFEILVRMGLQNEYNAQNILIGFDKSWNVASIVLRDMMGIEKDIGLREALGLPIEFDSAPYKILANDDSKYIIRHSFSFDFKVCHYVLNPLIKCATRLNIASRKELISILKDRTRYWQGYLPSDYFPKGVWYYHRNVLLTERDKRVYVVNRKPLLRD